MLVEFKIQLDISPDNLVKIHDIVSDLQNSLTDDESSLLFKIFTESATSVQNHIISQGESE